MPLPQCSTWVFHRGALGDSVLLWPLLRRLAARRHGGGGVALVTDESKARLAAQELGVRGVPIETRTFTALWVEGMIRPDPVSTARLIISFLGDRSTPPGRTWIENVRTLFPQARVISMDERLDRPLALRLGGRRLVERRARINPRAPIVLHVGAGSRDKWWPIERWAELRDVLHGRGDETRVIAGEVEAERFTDDQRRLFARMGGRFLTDLDELAATLKAARAAVCCDSGPAHLAAQLGVPTLALFGPTDPRCWGPIGPAVRVVAPEAFAPMTWLTADRAAAELDVLQSPESRSPASDPRA